jgi:hypothetical protein
MLSPTLVNRVRRLSRPQLLDLAALVEGLLAEIEQQPPEVPERADREVVEKTVIGAITFQLERVRCGKNCNGCPHGPYWYAYYRSAGRVVSKYIGKELDPRKVQR